MALKRELAAAVAIPIVFTILFFTPPLAFDGLVAAIALAALWEFYRLAEKTGLPVAKTVGVLGAVVTFTTPFQFVFRDDWMQSTAWLQVALLVVLATAFAATLAELVSRVPAPSALGGAAATVFGVLLIIFPAISIWYLRGVSPQAVVALLGIVWVCDSCAYYFGRLFGRHKLAPVVSPNKTWEGTIAGLIGATAFGAAAGTWILLPELGPWRGALAGALASSAGQIGDLVESLFKRGAGVKDSGTFLPGHGGVYDRIDSLLFAGPVLAVLVSNL